MRRRFLVVLALLAVVRSPAMAQTCAGLASYSRGPIQVAGHGAVATGGVGVYQVGASAGYGRPKSVFADVNIARTSADGAEGYLSYGADLGYQISTALVQICPTAAYTVSDLPDGFGFNNTSHTATMGMSMGMALGLSRLQIVPTGGISLQYVRDKSEDDAGNSGTQSDAYGVAEIGVGLVFNSISIRPEVAIPVGLTGADPALGLTIGINFGGRR